MGKYDKTTESKPKGYDSNSFDDKINKSSEDMITRKGIVRKDSRRTGLSKLSSSDSFEIIQKGTRYKSKSYNNLKRSVIEERTEIEKNLIKILEKGSMSTDLEFLLLEIKNLNYNHENISPLVTAIIYCNMSVIELLINHGSDVNFLDGNGNPPLYHAIMKKDAKLVNFLIQRDADFMAKNTIKIPIMLFATSDLKIMKIIVGHAKNLKINLNKVCDLLGNSFLHYAVTVKDNTKMIRYLIKNKLDLNAINEKGDSLLHHAVLVENNQNNIKFLIKKLKVGKAGSVRNIDYHNKKNHSAFRRGFDAERYENLVPILFFKMNKKQMDDVRKSVV